LEHEIVLLPVENLIEATKLALYSLSIQVEVEKLGIGRAN
jgi:hypothetical protein